MSETETPIKSKSSTVHSVVVAMNLLEYLAESAGHSALPTLPPISA